VPHEDGSRRKDHDAGDDEEGKPEVLRQGCERGAEGVPDAEHDRKEYDLSRHAKEDEPAVGDPRDAGGQQYRNRSGRRAEAERHLGQEEELLLVVLVQPFRPFQPLGSEEQELTVLAQGLPREEVADDVPEGVAYEVTEHEGQEGRHDGKRLLVYEEAADNEQYRTFERGEEHQRAVGKQRGSGEYLNKERGQFLHRLHTIPPDTCSFYVLASGFLMGRMEVLIHGPACTTPRQ
jgi:hypothetical protein